MARDAVAADVDVVMVAGGDGTVRVVCQELAGTGVPVALIPAGTGNLLARNLGVALDVMVAAPSGLRQLVQIASGIAWGAHVDPLTYGQARTVEIVGDQPVACQLDGDYEGESAFFRAEVLPGALRVMLDADGARPWAR